VSEYMEKISAEDISCKAEFFGFFYEPCYKSVDVRCGFGIFQKAQKIPDECVI